MLADVFEKGAYIALGLIVAAVVFFFGYFLIVTVKDGTSSNYWIETSSDTYYTDAYEEKDGCISFIDRYGANKLCGFYNVVDKQRR